MCDIAIPKPGRGPALVALFAAAATFACTAQESRSVTARVEGAPAALRVVVAHPRIAEENRTLTLPGTVEPWARAALFARVTGYLESIQVEIGDEVQDGAEIARIVVPEMQAQIRSADAHVAQEQAELELARVTRARLADLRQTNPEAIPQQDVDVAAAKEEFEVAQVKVAEAERDRLHALAGFGQLRAPFSGRIAQRMLDPGALVREGTSSQAQPVVEIVRTDRLRVVFEVPEPIAPYVRSGSPVTLRFDAFPGVASDATVARVSGSLDPSTRSMRAEVDLDNSGGRYGPGMYVSVRISAQAIDGALAVPSRAVRGQGDERYCLVARDGVLRRTAVDVASDDGRQALVVSGLTLEDRVMIAGSPLARDGAACEAVEEQTE